MKKEEKTFEQLVKQVIDNARIQAKAKWQETDKASRHLNSSAANIVDEWRMGPSQQQNNLNR